jgi:DNA polymerase (family 10)
VTPLHRTLAQLASLALIRGDSVEESLFVRAEALVRARQINADTDAGPLIDDPPPDVDAEIIKRLRQMYEAGGWVLVESALADVPGDLRWLYESGAVTIDQLAAIHRAIGVTSVADLVAAVREEKIRAIPGLDADLEAAVGAALPALRALTPRVPLGRATAIADAVLERLRAIPGVKWALPVGSLRRGQDMVGDIEIVAATSQPADAIADLLTVPDSPRVLHKSDRRLYLLIERIQVGVRLPDPENAGAALLYLTGSAAHFEALRAHAAASGWRLQVDGLRGSDGALHPSATEDAIYAALGLPTIPPEIREGTEEIALASRGELPALVARADIRGDLHMHSLWSDGRDPVETMVQGCVALGYEYMAITDHSPSSAATRNLTLDTVNKQADEIAELRERYPTIAILHGCEVDILPDGRLDFPDRILDRFDIVLASLHDSAGHAPDRLMKRYVSAMQHPLVTLITHPTNRLVPHRRGYDLDYDRLFELAVEHRTAVEIDGAPSHLDLDGALARRAIAAGATVAVNSDCHRGEMLAFQMHLGIITARRGWVEPRHVLNARSLGDVRAVIAAKRGGRTG